MRDERRNGQMSEFVHQMVFGLYMDQFITQVLILQPPSPLPQRMSSALKYLARPTHGENLTHRGLVSSRGNGINCVL